MASITIDDITNDPTTFITSFSSSTDSTGRDSSAFTAISFDPDNGPLQQFIHQQSSNGEIVACIELPFAEIHIFDREFYLNSNPDVAAQVADNPSMDPQYDPLLHYVESGAQEGRDPSPLFDSQYYLEQNPDVATALAGGDFSGDPLLHYVESGGQEGRDPNPFFDSDYYFDSVSDDDFAAELNPLEHYVLKEVKYLINLQAVAMARQEWGILASVSFYPTRGNYSVCLNKAWGLFHPRNLLFLLLLILAQTQWE